MALQEDLKTYRQNVVNKALEATKRLYSLSVELGKKETAHSFQNLIDKLESETFKLIIIGRFNNGKSTFANALLGQPSNGHILNGDKGPMPTADISCTAILTYVMHADRPSVKALMKDGETDEDWSFDRYLVDGRVPKNSKNSSTLDDIKSFVVGYPSPLLKEGLVLIDTPGTDDNAERTQIAREAIRNADAAIVVYSTHSLAGEGEINFVEQQLTGNVSKIYTVVNMFKEIDDDFKEFAWYRLLGENNTRSFDPNNPNVFQEYGIYFVDAKKAFEGKRDRNLALQQKSGLLQFEQAVADFLTRESGKTHLLSSIKPANYAAKEMANEIGRQQTVLTAGAEQFRQALDKSRPRLLELKKKPEELKRDFAYFESQLRAKLRTAYELFLLGLPDEIIDHMRTVDLPSLKNYTDILFKQKQCADEAKLAAEKFVALRTKQWSEGEAYLISSKVMEEMVGRLEEVINKAKSDARFIEIHLNSALTAGEGISMSNKWDKVLGVAYGLISLDPLGGLAVSQLGWKAMATDFISKIIILSVLSTLTGPIGFLVVITGSALIALFRGSKSASENLRKNMAESFIDAINKERPKMLQELDKGIEEKFKKLSEPIISLVQREVAIEIEGIEQMTRDNEQGKAEKITQIEKLERYKNETLIYQGILSDIHLNT